MGSVFWLRCFFVALAIDTAQLELPITKLIKSKQDMNEASKNMQTSFDDQQNVQKFIIAVREVESFAEMFISSPRLVGKEDLKGLSNALNDADEKLDWIDQTTITSHKLKTCNFFKYSTLTHEIKEKIDKKEPEEVQSNRLCKSLFGTNRFQSLEVDMLDICNDTQSCAHKQYLFQGSCEEEGDEECEQDLNSACGDMNVMLGIKRCKLESALPMMAGVFWYKTNDIIFNVLCGNRPDESVMKKFSKDAERLIMFANCTEPQWQYTWKPFFDQVLDTNAFSDIHAANSLIKKRREDTILEESTRKLCDVMKFPRACSIIRLFEQYDALIAFTSSRKSSSFRDLSDVGQVNHKKMVQLEKNDLQFQTVFGAIRKLDRSLKTSVKGISKYFGALAKYDYEIAEIDFQTFKGRMEKYERKSKRVMSVLIEKMERGMALLMTLSTLKVIQEAQELALLVAANCNPIKAIVSSPDLKEIMEQAGQLANAVSEQAKVIALITTVVELAKDSKKIADAFNANTKQIKSIKAIIGKITGNKNLQINDIDEDLRTFTSQYGSYTPKLDHDELAKNDALWTAYKDSMCNFFDDDDVGVKGAAVKGIVGGDLLCEQLAAILSQFFTLRQSIFEFQDEMVDSIAKFARAHLAKKYAANIKEQGESLDASEILIGLYIKQSSLQRKCYTYCDALEYNNFGKAVQPCQPTDGLFAITDINSLITYRNPQKGEFRERNTFLPTQSESNKTGVETGVIDLDALGRGETVIFKIPSNTTWLRKYKWMYDEDKHVPLVKDLELFLPKTAYDARSDQRISITLKASHAQSELSLDKASRLNYHLPESSLTFSTVYHEGYLRCSKSQEIHNPYSLCKNLPKICKERIKTKPRVHPDKIQLLPTILSHWELKVNVKDAQGESIKYVAPIPATNLLLRVTATLKVFIGGEGKRRDPVQRFPSMDQNRCCDQGNTYYEDALRKCVPCPTNTTKIHRGLFCQIT